MNSNIAGDESQSSSSSLILNVNDSCSLSSSRMSVNRTGINISDAMLILSSRAKSGGEMRAHEIPSEMRQMGQTIDLFADGDKIGCTSVVNKRECDDVGTDGREVIHETKEDAKKRQSMEKERKEREEKIKSELETLTVSQLLNTVLEIQQERVLTYKNFDRGLDLVLKTGNVSTYPTTCGNATASFAVLSTNINSIAAIFLKSKAKHHKNYYSLLTQLQKEEKEKLNLTAALHLEQMRKQNHVGVKDVEKSQNDDQIYAMLCDAVLSLKQKISSCIEKINELLEDLRYAALEENEKDSNS